MSRTFEMSASGPLSLGTVVECGVCWWTYDPRTGDMDHDLMPGVGFSDLPLTFRCPACDAPKDKFMIKPGTETAADTNAYTHNHTPDAVPLEERLESLRAAYHKAEDSMVGLPVHNPALEIDLTEFQETAEGYIGVVITPWCMNLTLLPFDQTTASLGAIGTKRMVAFPSGSYSFLAAHLDGFGALETCSLISPMEDFDDPEVAKLTAEAALTGLFEAVAPKDDAQNKPAAEPSKPKSRRAFLMGRRSEPSPEAHPQ